MIKIWFENPFNPDCINVCFFVCLARQNIIWGWNVFDLNVMFGHVKLHGSLWRHIKSHLLCFSCNRNPICHSSPGLKWCLAIFGSVQWISDGVWSRRLTRQPTAWLCVCVCLLNLGYNGMLTQTEMHSWFSHLKELFSPIRILLLTPHFHSDQQTHYLWFSPLLLYKF